MKRRKLLYLILPVIALILEILPYGAVCNFANPEGEPWRRTYSYFDLTPFGYANFAPLLTAIITCAVLILLLVYLFIDKHCVLKAVKILLCASVILSLCPLMLGINFFSIVGAMITVSLIAEMVLLFVTAKTQRK